MRHRRAQAGLLTLLYRAPIKCWASYTAALNRRPVVVASVTSGLMYGAGDWMAQNIEKTLGVQSHGKTGYNYPRTGRMVTFGLLVGGPVLAVWYPTLHRLTSSFRRSFKPRLTFINKSWVKIYRKKEKSNPRERMVEGGIKVLCDNLFFQPPFITLYLFTMGILEGRPLSETYERMRMNFHDIWATSLLVWVPAQVINFAIVPVYLQALYVNIVNMGWKTIMSVLYHVRDYGAANHTDRRDKLESEYVALRKELEELRARLGVQQQLIEAHGLTIDEGRGEQGEERGGEAAVAVQSVAKAGQLEVHQTLDTATPKV